MAKRILTDSDIAMTTRVLNPDVQVSTEHGESFTAEVLNFVGPLEAIPSFTRQALYQHVGTRLDAFFKHIRQASQYRKEWDLWANMPDRGSREWTMLVLSLCAQFAVETSVFHPYLAQDAKKWLRAKFCEQGVTENFDDRWEVYSDTTASDLLTSGPFYLRIGPLGILRFQWIGEFPNRPRSDFYQLSIGGTALR